MPSGRGRNRIRKLKATEGGVPVRRLALTLTLAGVLAGAAAAPAAADVSTTQTLPAAACNEGTMDAHESVPEATGTGVTTPAHEAIPGTENVTPCGHGG
jgi:hypothetical protein